MIQKNSISEIVKKYSKTSIEQLFNDLSVTENGYDENKINEHRKKYGSNISLTSKHESFMTCLRRAFINPFSIILFCLGSIHFATDVLMSSSHQKSFTTVYIIFSMLIISGIVRLVQELKAKKIADELVNLVDTSVKVFRNNTWVDISSEELVVGDRIKISAGDRIGADVRLIETMDLFVSQSVITGESIILEKNADVIETDPKELNDFTNVLFSGTTVTGGYGIGIVLAVGKNTVYGGFDTSESVYRHGFDQGANSIAWVLIKFMVILVPIVFIASGLTQDDWSDALIFALSVAVGLTPELLPMVVNACLAKGSYSMREKQTIVKNINAMQGFGSMDVLCVDKTGTLTGDEIILEYYMDILGNESQKTLDYAYLSSYYQTGVINHIDEAIRKVQFMENKAEHLKELVAKHTKINEHPFDYSRHFGSVLLEDNDEHLLIIKGSIDDVLRHCKWIEYKNQKMEIGLDSIQSAHEIVDEMLEDGMKVIAIAYKHIKDTDLQCNEEDEFILLVYLAFFDAPKKSAESAMDKLRQLNVNIKVLTGDQVLVAKSICKRLHMDVQHYVTGKQLATIDEKELPKLIEKTHIFAELSPKQKALIVEYLQADGHTVGFLGDGMNDLPAMLQADVGISVENATEAVKECANVILLKKDLNVLEEGIFEGRKAFANMSKYIKITASSNFGNICAIVIASVLLPFFPMTSIQLLLLNLLYDILCLVLPWDNVDDDMIHMPLEWSGNSLAGFMAFFGPLSSVFDLITFAFLFFVLCPMICGGSFLQLQGNSQLLFVSLFQTGWFLESMWTQVLILQLLRSKHLPFIQSKPGKPVIVFTTIGISLLTLLPFTSFGQLLGLCPLPMIYFMYLIGIVVLYLLLVSFAKSFYIHRKNKLI